MCTKCSYKSQLGLTGSSATAEGPHDALYQLKSCQLLHSCTKITLERLAVGNDLEGDSRSSELPLLNRLYITSYYSSVVTTTLYLAPFARYHHIYSSHDWLWPWEFIREKRFCGWFVVLQIGLDVVYLCAKLDHSSFSLSENIIWPQVLE